METLGHVIQHLPEGLLHELSGRIAQTLGVEFPPERWRDLERGLKGIAAELDLGSPEACAQWLLESKPTEEQIDLFARNFTVGETYFFRDPRVFQALEQHILPELLRRRGGAEKRLRIWSAACCTGEEVYSIAITLRRILPDYPDWQVTLLGTDINRRFLEQAAAGVYREWSFRNAPAWLRPQYFRKRGHDRWELLPEIRRMVTFSRLNLVLDPYPSLLKDTHSMDVIFCRNTLIYFGQEQVRKVIRKLHRCLAPEGWLFVSPSEAPHPPGARFIPVHFEGTLLHRKARANGRNPGFPAHPEWTPIDPAEDAPEPTKPVTERVAVTGTATDTGTFTGLLPFPSAPLFESKPAVPAPNGAARTVACNASSHSDSAHTSGPVSVGQEPPGTELLRTARAHADRGHLQEALGGCDQLLAADKLNTAAHYLRASVLCELARFDEARAALRSALYLEPDFVPAHVALGDLARVAGDGTKAQRHFANALTILGRQPADRIIPETGGITSGRLAEVLRSLRREFS